MKNDIKCTVKSCKYNEDCCCCAKDVEINNNVEVTDDMEFGNFDHHNAQSSPQTRCETFIPRD